MTGNSKRPEDIEWEWDDVDEGGRGRPAELRTEDGGRFAFVPAGNSAMIERHGSRGEPLWTMRTTGTRANAAALVSRASTLYAALYSHSATGCRVLALDSASGKHLWETPLEGLGSLHHSKYSNAVQMRFIGNHLAIFGKEAGGRYIEVLDPENGQRTFGQKLPRSTP